MILKKITTGFVIQDFDTETGQFVKQDFIAGDDVSWEDEKGNDVEVPSGAPGFPFEMEQPDAFKVFSVWDENDVIFLEEENNWHFTTEERREILQLFKNREDAFVGLNWDQLEQACGQFLQQKRC